MPLHSVRYNGQSAKVCVSVWTRGGPRPRRSFQKDGLVSNTLDRVDRRPDRIRLERALGFLPELVSKKRERAVVPTAV